MSGTHSRGRATQEQLPRTYWQKIAGKFVPDIFNRLYPYRRPAFSALPPSVAVVCRGYVSLQRWPYKVMNRQHNELIALLEPVVTALGYEMLGIEYFKQKDGSMLRLYIDSDVGITIDDCTRVNHQVIGVLDVHDPIKEKYFLEISSPGLDRPLFTLAQFQRFLGKKVKMKLREKIEERRRIKGVIKAVEETVVLISQDGIDYSIPVDLIDSAHLVPEI